MAVHIADDAMWTSKKDRSQEDCALLLESSVKKVLPSRKDGTLLETTNGRKRTREGQVVKTDAARHMNEIVLAERCVCPLSRASLDSFNVPSGAKVLQSRLSDLK